MDRQSRKDNNEPRPLYERQLDEILRESDRVQQRRQFWAGTRRTVSRLFAGGSHTLPHSRLIGVGLVLLIVGGVLRGALPTLGGLLILGGVLLFLSPIVLSFGRPRGGSSLGPGDEKLWRGRPVVYGDDPWRTTRNRVNGVVRWFRGGSNRPRGGPPRTGRWN
jgi:hypothetical protein